MDAPVGCRRLSAQARVSPFEHNPVIRIRTARNHSLTGVPCSRLSGNHPTNCIDIYRMILFLLTEYMRSPPTGIGSGRSKDLCFGESPIGPADVKHSWRVQTFHFCCTDSTGQANSSDCAAKHIGQFTDKGIGRRVS